MFKTRALLISILTLFIVLPANAFEWCFWSKPNVDVLENPKKNADKALEKEEDLPDILMPEPETPKEIKKKEKEAKKVKKHSSKKAKEPKFKKSKHLKKYTYRRVRKMNNAPLTYAQYLEMAKDVKRESMNIPRPSVQKDEKIVDMPDPELRIIKYNNPPGSRDLDLRLLMTKRQLVTQGVLSPDEKRMIYSVVYSYPTAEQVASEMFIINIPDGASKLSALRDFYTMEAERTPILRAGTDRLAQNEKKTLVLLDWSEDGQKVAVKEKIGSQTQGPWKTQLWAYDFETQKAYELSALREAIRYYWKNMKGLDLVDYMWDIYPIGWDKYNKDRIISYAYVYGKDHKGSKFLGTWSIDYKNQRSELMSETEFDFEVSVNGYRLDFTHN